MNLQPSTHSVWLQYPRDSNRVPSWPGELPELTQRNKSAVSEHSESTQRALRGHSKSTQSNHRALREQSDNTQRIKIRVNTVRAFKYCVLLENSSIDNRNTYPYLLSTFLPNMSLKRSWTSLLYHRSSCCIDPVPVVDQNEFPFIQEFQKVINNIMSSKLLLWTLNSWGLVQNRITLNSKLRVQQYIS